MNECTRKDIKQLYKTCEYCGKALERKRFNGRLEDFGVFKRRKYCDRECMRKAYLRIDEGHNQSWYAAHNTARNINKLILKQTFCQFCGSEKNLDIHHIDGNWRNNTPKNLICLCRSCHMKEERRGHE